MLTYKELIKLDNAITNEKRRCKCSHTQLVRPMKGREYGVCTHCGARLYKTDQEQQQYEKELSKKEFINNFKKFMHTNKEMISSGK